MNVGLPADASSARAPIGVVAAAAGMGLFALCAHQGLPWAAVAAGGMLVATAAIAWSRFGVERPAAVLGLERPDSTAAVLSAAGLAIGAGGGLLHRRSLGLALGPDEGLEAWVVVACLIGATEEIVYRGWLLGRARALGWPVAVVISALAHGVYKTALFAWPAAPVPADLGTIASWTIAGGIVLGSLRVRSGSVLPPVLAHVAFDFVTYRSVASAPWWVWG